MRILSYFSLPHFPLAYLLLAAATLGGCASSMSGGAYSRQEAGREQEVQLGVVESVRVVQIEGTKSGVGALAGAGVGAVAGSTLGQGKGSSITSILGAVAGGVGGAAAEEGVTRQKGYEILVKLDSGRTVAVVQGTDVEFKRGDRVRLLTVSGKTRVTHLE